MKYAIHIVPDTYPENPFEEWDCEPPIIASHGRDGVRSYGVDDRCPTLTEAVVRKHWRDMLGAIVQGWEPGVHGSRRWFTYEATWRGLLAFARNEYDTHSYPLWDVLADAFAEHVNGENPTDRFDQLVEVYGWMGIHAYNGSTSGYRQGNYADVLVVWTPEWLAKTGVNPDTMTSEQIEKALRATVDLYGAWAWGDVYGYVITEYDEGDEDAPTPDDWHEGVPVFHTFYGKYPDGDLDSCWGYYGTDCEASGLYHGAVDAIRHLEAADRKEAAERQYWAERDTLTVGA